jgi:hypothetical protein
MQNLRSAQLDPTPLTKEEEVVSQESTPPNEMTATIALPQLEPSIKRSHLEMPIHPEHKYIQPKLSAFDYWTVATRLLL